MQNTINMCCCQRLVGDCRNRVNAHLKQGLQSSTNYIKSQIKYSQHNKNKTRNRGILSGKNPVNFLTSYSFSALFWLYHSTFAYFFNEIESHISNSRTPVQATFLFHLQNQMFQCFFLILIQLKLF